MSQNNKQATHLQLFISMNAEDEIKHHFPRVSMAAAGGSGVVVSTLDFISKGWWFEFQSLPSYCFLRQESLPSLST